MSLRARAGFSVKGRYKAIVHNGDGVPIRETGWGKNVLTNNGVDRMFAGDSFLQCVVGTGSSAPLVTDTSLDNYAGKYDIWHACVFNRNYAASPYYYQRIMTARFLPGTLTASSINLSECGMVFTDNNGSDYTAIDGSTTIHSRALFLDAGGNPVTVTLLADEYLDIIWEWTWYVMDEYTDTVTLDVDGIPTVFDIKVWPCNMAQGSGSQSDPSAQTYSFGWGQNTGSQLFSQGIEGGSRGSMLWRGVGLTIRPAQTSTNSRGLTMLMPSVATGPGDLPNPSGGASSYAPTGITEGSYSPGDANRDYTYLWGLGNGNISGGGTLLNIIGRFGHWQIDIDPGIVKSPIQIMELTFNVAIDNTP